MLLEREYRQFLSKILVAFYFVVWVFSWDFEESCENESFLTPKTFHEKKNNRIALVAFYSSNLTKSISIYVGLRSNFTSKVVYF